MPLILLMLSLALVGSPAYYLELQRSDYYTKGGEPPGVWVGEGATELGLSGTVSHEQLENLFKGLSPDGSRSLVQVQHYKDGRSRQPAWDLALSAPKSVSVLWSQSPDCFRQDIQAAHFEAVKAALRYLENAAGRTRRGRGGRFVEEARLLFACFEHGTSRLQDPQLHTHCLALNVAVRSDGSTGTVISKNLFKHKMAAGALYRAELARGLRRLGLDLRREGSWFEVEGVSKELCAFFSKRSQAIQEKADRIGFHSAIAKAKLCLTTREVKAHVAREKLFEEWGSVGERFGYKPELPTPGAPGSVSQYVSREVVSQALLALTTSSSTFRAKDLVSELAVSLQAAGVGADAIVRAADTALGQGERVVPLGTDRNGFALYSTPETMRVEASLLNDAAHLHEQATHGVGKSHVTRSLKDAALPLRPEQRDAVRHVTSPGALALLSGMAGTGKTAALTAAREAWERQGFRVLGAGLSARAAKELQEGAGIRSRTIDSLLFSLRSDFKYTAKHHARMLFRQARATWRYHGSPKYRVTWKLRAPLDKKTVLVVDETSLVPTTKLERVLREARRAGAKVVLVGDERQLQPVEAGQPFGTLLKSYGGARLEHIGRQKEEWGRQAVHAFAEGSAREALSQFALRERLHVFDTSDEAAKRLVRRWNLDRQARPEHTSLMLAGTRDDVAKLNSLAQELRYQGGELRRSLRTDELELFEGDRVLFQRNDRSNIGVLNGDFGTLTAISGGRSPKVAATLDDGRTVAFTATDMKPDRFGQELLSLGYATTAQKAQGATVDRAYILAAGREYRELAYVEASRSRFETHIYTTEAAAGEDLVELARSMARSEQKPLAHDAARELQTPPPAFGLDL